MDFTSSTSAARDRASQKGIVAKSSVVSRRLLKNRIE